MNRADIRTGVSDTAVTPGTEGSDGLREMIALNLVEAALVRGDVAAARAQLDVIAAEDIDTFHNTAIAAVVAWFENHDHTAVDQAVGTCREEDDIFGSLWFAR